MSQNTSWQFSSDVVNGSDIFTEFGFRSGHPNYELIYPIIFNLKHGIELYLKGLGNIDHGEYQHEHDLKKLFAFVLGKAKRYKQNYQIFQQLYKDVWPAVEKYYHGTYIPNRKSKSSPDRFNDAERYPETRKGVYKIPKPYKWVTKQVLIQIENDIKFFESKFSEIQKK